MSNHHKAARRASRRRYATDPHGLKQRHHRGSLPWLRWRSAHAAELARNPQWPWAPKEQFD